MSKLPNLQNGAINRVMLTLQKIRRFDTSPASSRSRFKFKAQGGIALLYRFVGATIMSIACSGASALAVDTKLSTLACSMSDTPEACQKQQKLIIDGPPADGKITVSNTDGGTIYKIFAWPTDLNPRTYNILSSPLLTGNKTELIVDNAYGDCNFTFQYDSNDPGKMRNLAQSLKKGYVFKPLVSVYTNICGGNTFLWLGKIPTGKLQGRP